MSRRIKAALIRAELLGRPTSHDRSHPAWRASRPAPVEWTGAESDLAGLPHGTPLLRRGRLQAGSRDASFLHRPDVTSVKASHILVVSHNLAVGGGMCAPAAACDPVRIMLAVPPWRDAGDVHPRGRCRRPGCHQLFAAAVAAQKHEPDIE